VVDFYDDDNAMDKITKSVLANFWLAIYRGTLEVKVGEVKIDKDSLQELLRKHFDEYDTDPDTPNPLPFYSAFTMVEGPSKKLISKELPTLGSVELHIGVKDKYPKRVSYFRLTGMEIQRKIHHLPIPYAGVFICENDDGNEILRMMENPQHNEWMADNAREKTEEVYKKAKSAEEEIRELIREIKKSFQSDDKDFHEVPGLSKYLPFEEESLDSFTRGSNSGEEQSEASEDESGIEVGATAESAGVEILKPIEVLKKESEKSGGGDAPGPGRKGGKGKDVRTHAGGEGEGNKFGPIINDVKMRSYARRDKNRDCRIYNCIVGRKLAYPNELRLYLFIRQAKSLILEYA